MRKLKCYTTIYLFTKKKEVMEEQSSKKIRYMKKIAKWQTQILPC